MTTAEVDVLARLTAGLNNVASELASDRRRKAELATAVWYAHAPAISFPGSAAPYLAPQWGPNTGYAWAVQRLTVTPLGTNDLLSVYRGSQSGDNMGQNVLYEFGGNTSPPLVTQAWHPGRTGLILMPDESLLFGGTLTSATQYFVNIDVIQLEVGKLAYFLL